VSSPHIGFKIASICFNGYGDVTPSVFFTVLGVKSLVSRLGLRGFLLLVALDFYPNTAKWL
jgi:hypothetical protein